MEEVRAVMGRNPQMGQGYQYSWSGRVGSEAETERRAGGRGRVSGQG